MSKAEKTKQFIVERTAGIFNKKGYAGTSLQDITAATSLTKGSIYGNFTGKDEVALAVFDYNINRVRHILRTEMSKYESIREKLLVYPEVYGNIQRYPFPEGGCPMLNTAVEADDTHPALRRKAQEAITYWKNSLVRTIEKGIARKEIKASVDPEQQALTIMALLEGMTMIANLMGKSTYRKQLVQSVEKIITDMF
jgi:TetR/AcrR family transcriptional repressor of nem operon